MDELIRVQSRDGSERFLRFDDEMIERAACAMWAWDHEERTGFVVSATSWPDIENPDHYRALAREALHAAFNQGEAHGGD